MRSLFNKALLREQLQRYWVISAFAFLIYFLGCLLPLWSTSYNNEANSMILDIVHMQNPFVLIANIVIPLAAVLSVFSYMYKKNAAGVMHSMPFTKKQLFATNFLAGYILVIAPLFVFSALLMVMRVQYNMNFYPYAEVGNYYHGYISNLAANVFPNGLDYRQVINTIPVVLGFFARTALSYTFYYILFVTAAMVVGNQIVYILVSGLFTVLAAGLYLLFSVAGYYYVYGYIMNEQILMNILQYTNPLAIYSKLTWIRTGVDSFDIQLESLIPLYATYIIIAAALLALSIWLYHTRKLERAGETVVFTPVKNVLIFLVSVLGMISLGMLFLAMFNSVIVMYIGFAIGFIIAFFIAQMIAEQNFNVFYKYKSLIKYGGTAIGILAAVIILSRADITGYVRYVPNASEVEGVHFGWYYGHGSEYNNRFITSADTINETLAIHQKIVDARAEQRKVFLDYLAGNYYSRYQTQRINYLMKDGREVSREYVLTSEFMENSGFTRLLNTERVILSEIPWIYSPEFMDSIQLEPRFYGKANDHGYREYMYSDDIMVSGRADIASLCEAIKKDYVYYRTNEKRRYDTVVHVQKEWNEMSVQFYMSRDYNRGNRLYVWLQSSENTMDWLISNGYYTPEEE